MDFPLRGVYANNCVYETVRSWDSFGPALNRAELLDPESIWQFALDIPEEWSKAPGTVWRSLSRSCRHTRRIIRNIISDFRNSHPQPAFELDRIASCSLLIDERPDPGS